MAENSRIVECVDETIECMCKKIQDESTNNFTNMSQLGEMTAALAALITANAMLEREVYTSRICRSSRPKSSTTHAKKTGSTASTQP